MEKKAYVSPEMEVVEMTEKHCILETSDTNAGGGGTGTPPGWGDIEE